MEYRRLSIRKVLRALSLLLALPFLVFAAPSIAAENHVSIENTGLRVSFDSATGQLVEFTDRENAHAFVEYTAGDELWTIQALAPSEVAELRPSMAGTFTHRVLDEHTDSLELAWQDFGIAEARLCAWWPEYHLPGRCEAYWSIAIEDKETCRG